MAKKPRSALWNKLTTPILFGILYKFGSLLAAGNAASKRLKHLKDWAREFIGRKVVVTGGLGFIGSNLALRLAEMGATVTVVDAEVPGCGANPFNLAPARNAISVSVARLDDSPQVLEALEGADLVFNLAGEISHSHSMRLPDRDLAMNATAQQRFLETCARYRPGLRVVYAGTRQVYGVPQCLPVDESHPVAPVDYNGVHKYAAEHYHLLLTRLGRLDAVVLRLTNVYGPRLAIQLSCQGFLATFVRRTLLREPLVVFGDGQQLRDPLYVDDAVNAFLRAALIPRPEHRIINVGSGVPISLLEIAESFARISGLPTPQKRPFPPERKAIDIGSYYSCTERAATILGWMPRVEFQEGLKRTLAYFEEHRDHYLTPERACRICDAGTT